MKQSKYVNCLQSIDGIEFNYVLTDFLSARSIYDRGVSSLFMRGQINRSLINRDFINLKSPFMIMNREFIYFSTVLPVFALHSLIL